MELHLTNIPAPLEGVVRGFAALLSDPNEAENLRLFMTGRSVLRVDTWRSTLLHQTDEDIVALVDNRHLRQEIASDTYSERN